MSVITVQIGQCGNQLGGSIYSTLANDNATSSAKSSIIHNETALLSKELYFNEENDKMPPKARSVLVDMEPKVISHAISEAKRSGLWQYNEKNSFCRKRGSGNNWAHGYCSHGPQHRSAVMDLIRREVEMCDRLGGFLCLMSLAGGTGSGMGTLLTEALHDEYRNNFLLNVVVSPYSTGEVIVQNYNAILTLAHLYQCADAIIVMNNDTLHRSCKQLMGIKNVSFADINSVCSHQLASVLQPVHTPHIPGLNRSHIGDLLETLVCHPQYKLLNLLTIPQSSVRSRQFSTYQWPGLLKHLRQMLIADSALEEGIDWSITARYSSDYFNKSVANLLYLRGAGSSSAAEAETFKDKQLYPPWLPECCPRWHNERPFNNYEKLASLLSNSQSVVKTLDGMTAKAWKMFGSHAFVHQYMRHGLSEENFLDCFAVMEQTISSYKKL